MKFILRKLINFKITELLKKDSKGVALLLSLGMMGMLFVIAVGFVSTTGMDLKMATINCEMAQSEILAESGLNCAVCLLQSTFKCDTVTDDETLSFNTLDITPATSAWRTNLNHRRFMTSYSPTSAVSRDMLYLMGTNIGSGEETIPFLDWRNDDFYSYQADSDFEEQLLSRMSWVYVDTDGGNGGSGNPLIGRYAFLIINESAKINPIMFKDSDRYGKTVAELSAQTYADSSDSARQQDAINYLRDPSSYSTVGTWLGMDHLVGTIVNSTTAGQSPGDWDRERCNEIYTKMGADSYATRERYFLDGKWRHRFNLARTDWDSLSPSDLVSEPSQYYDKDSAADGGGLGWLNKWTESETNEYSATNRALQIAANLIDYCDANNVPTTDGQITGTTPNHVVSNVPTYIGLDSGAPKITEVALRFDLDVTKTSSGMPPSYVYDYNVDAYPGVELWYWNNDGGSQDVEAYIEFTVECQGLYPTLSNAQSNSGAIAGTSVTSSAKREIFELNSNSTLNSSIATYGGALLSIGAMLNDLTKANVASWASPYMSGGSSSLGILDNYTEANMAVRIKISGVKAYLVGPNNKLYDYCELSNTTYYLCPQEGSPAYLDFQVKDPRHNRFASLWTASTSSGDITLCPNSKLNNSVQPSSGSYDSYDFANGHFDSSDLDSFGGISSRYIRNAPMKSPWELGAIHRAGTWQTLNLKNYTDSQPGTYAEGDAGILNQIKMNSKPYNQKININTDDEALLGALLSGIDVPSDGGEKLYAGDVVGGNALTKAAIASRVTGILAGNGVTAQEPLRDRAMIALSAFSDTVARLQADYDQAGSGVGHYTGSEMQRECVIGKIANLLKATGHTDQENNEDMVDAPQYFTVIVIAQSLRDKSGRIVVDINKDGKISTVDETSGAFPYDYDGDGLTKTTSITEPDGSTSATKGVYDQYIDEVTSTTKIMAYVKRDPETNKFTILSSRIVGETSEIDME